MKTLKLNKIILFLFISAFFQIFSITKKINSHKEEILILKFEEDSILEKKIIEIDKIYKEKKFDLALKKSFQTLDSLKSDDIEALLKINFLIGNIFYETLNYKDGIKYFRKNINLISNKISIERKDNFLDSVKSVLYIESFLRLGSSYHKLKKEIV